MNIHGRKTKNQLIGRHCQSHAHRHVSRAWTYRSSTRSGTSGAFSGLWNTNESSLLSSSLLSSSLTSSTRRRSMRRLEQTSGSAIQRLGRLHTPLRDHDLPLTEAHTRPSGHWPHVGPERSHPTRQRHLWCKRLSHLPRLLRRLKPNTRPDRVDFFTKLSTDRQKRWQTAGFNQNGQVVHVLRETAVRYDRSCSTGPNCIVGR